MLLTLGYRTNGIGIVGADKSNIAVAPATELSLSVANSRTREYDMGM